MAPDTSQTQRRCRACGSRALTLVWVSDPEGVPSDVAALNGDAEPQNGHLRWRCRRCGATMRYEEARPGLWRRRRPLSTWLFGGLG